jgi:hypothetical protein
MPAELTPHIISQPGAMGLNSEAASIDLPSAFALEATNAVFDQEGRLTSRGEHRLYSTQPGGSGAGIGHVAVYKGRSGSLGTQSIFVCRNNDIYYSPNPSITPYDQASLDAGVASWIGNNWTSAQLNNEVYFHLTNSINQDTKVFSFASLSFAEGNASVPAGKTICAAFQRLWVGGVRSNPNTLYWSVLSDGDDFTGVGSGSLDLLTVWGDDEIVAIREFGNLLAVFGFDNILLLANPFNATFASDGSGVPATTMQVAEVIKGVGCVSRECAVQLGEEIAFLSKTGLRTLGRTVQEKSLPLSEVSQNIDDEIREVAETARGNYVANDYRVKMAWDPRNRRVLVTNPNSAYTYCFEMGRRLEGGAAAVTKWDLGFFAMTWAEFGNTFTPHLCCAAAPSGFTEGLGSLGSIVGNTTVENESFTFTYSTPWLHLDAPAMNKILKRMVLSYETPFSVTKSVTVSWYYDYSATAAGTFTFTTGSGGAFENTLVPLSGNGGIVRFKIDIAANSGVGLQRIATQFKRGRLQIGV